MIRDVERGIKEVLWKSIREGVYIKNLKKIKKITFALIVTIAVVFHTPMTVQAADAEFRMMRGEQEWMAFEVSSTEEEQKMNVTQAEGVEQVEELAEAGGIELTENESVSIGIIGGADGPTSIFLAGKLGTGFKITMTLIIVVPVIIIAWIIWRIVKKK